MSIDIRHIAKLARLKIDDSQIEKIESQMQSIVDMVENLPDTDQDLVLDSNNPMELRQDIAVQNKFTRNELVKNAPQVQAGCFVVPKTVE